MKLSRLLRKLLKSIAVLFFVVFFYGRIFVFDVFSMIANCSQILLNFFSP